MKNIGNQIHGSDLGKNMRVTRIGKIIRATKIDELPEFINVLTGDMSIVGPRPEIEKYVNTYLEEFKGILVIKPGITDFASIKYQNEEKILEQEKNSEKYYKMKILPDKLRLARKYIDNISFRTDVHIITETIKIVLQNARNLETNS